MAAEYRCPTCDRRFPAGSDVGLFNFWRPWPGIASATRCPGCGGPVKHVAYTMAAAHATRLLKAAAILGALVWPPCAIYTMASKADYSSTAVTMVVLSPVIGYLAGAFVAALPAFAMGMSIGFVQARRQRLEFDGRDLFVIVFGIPLFVLLSVVLFYLPASEWMKR